jgi:hypothetical protein
MRQGLPDDFDSFLFQLDSWRYLRKQILKQLDNSLNRVSTENKENNMDNLC